MRLALRVNMITARHPARSRWAMCGFPPALASGVLLAIAHAPLGAGVIAFVALVPWLRSVSSVEPRAAAAQGACVAAIGYGLPLAFLPLAPLREGPAGLVAFGGIVGGLALGFAAIGASLSRLARVSFALACLAAPVGWLALEALRATPGIGVPWLQLGVALADVPLLASGASVVGLLGLSAGIVAINAALALRGAALERTILASAYALPLAVALATNSPAGPTGPSIAVAAVQPATPEARRHEPAHFDANLRSLLELSDGIRGARPDLIAWPESAYERSVSPAGDAFLGALSRDLDAALLTGAWRREANDLGWRRNAVILAEADGRQRVAADKVRPIPVYERAPRGPLSRWLAARGWWPGHFAPGVEPEPIRLGPSADVGVLVCVDLAYGDLVRRLRARGARLLVHVTNESGLGGWAGRIHARLARLRAIEMRVPVVRVSNQGPSQWIDARGNLVAEIGAGASGAALHSLIAAGPAPPAVRLGAPGRLFAFAACGGVIPLIVRRRHRSAFGLYPTRQENSR